MNYFNLIFSNKSILRIFQLEIFKKFKINGDIIEFGASDDIEKNFCNSKLKNCKISYSNINSSNCFLLTFKRIVSFIDPIVSFTVFNKEDDKD